MNWLMHKRAGVPNVVWVMLLLFIVVATGINVVQMRWFMFDGLDLAIFDQVVWNTAGGRWYEYSFNDYSYIVDHRSWMLLLFVPLYWVLPSPLTLLFVQAVGLAAAAVPLYLLAKKVLDDSKEPRSGVMAVGAVALYLGLASTFSQATSEFHMLPFATALLLWLWYAAMEQRWVPFWVLVVALLLIREDLGLVLVGVAALLPLIFGRRMIRVSSVLALVSGAWFVLMMYIGAWAAPDGAAKFFVFYDYLGATPGEAILYTLANPRDALEVLLDYDHALYVWFLFAQVGFVALLRLRYMIPALFPLAVYLFIPEYILAPMLKGHYAALVTPWLMLATVHGWVRLRQRIDRLRRFSFLDSLELQWTAPFFVIALMLFHVVSMSAIWRIGHDFKKMQQRDIAKYREVVEMIVPDDAVLTTARFDPQLSQRNNLYYAQHVFSGKRHFSDVPYELPSEVDWIILEQEEVLRAGIHIPAEDRELAWERFGSMVEKNNLAPVVLTTDLVVYGPASQADSVLPSPVEIGAAQYDYKVDTLVNDDIRFLGWSEEQLEDGRTDLQFVLRRNTKHAVAEDDQHLLLRWMDDSGEVVREKLIALGYGMDPTHAWKDGPEAVARTVHVPVTHPENATQLTVSFSVLDRELGPLFTMWSVDPVLDAGYRVDFPLTELMSL